MTDAYKAAAEGTDKPKPHFANASERARHASLVRWKKENPIAANVQQRLEQIRAARMKKGKGGGKGKAKAGGKGKAAAKPELTPEQRKQAKQQEQAAAREVTLKGAGVGEDARASLDNLASGKDVDDDGGLEKMGLAERGKDGKLRLTSAGRAVHRAAGRGDAGAVKDAISRAKDKATEKQNKPARQAKQKQRKAKRTKAKAKAKPVIEKEEPARRIGDRMRQTTRKSMDIDSIIIELDAIKSDMADDDAIKAGRRNSGNDQAQIDRGYELAMDLCDLFEALGADTGEEEGEEEEGVNEEMAEAGEIEGKAIGKREDVNPKEGVSEYGDVRFADAKNKKYPIDTADHVRAAWNYINKPDNAAKYDPDEVATIKKNIVAAWKKLIDKAGPPSAETKKDAEELIEMVIGAEVKSMGGDQVRGLAIRFGNPDEPDMSHMRDFFSKDTAYWLDAWKTRPMLYHHAMEENTADDPIVGTWTKAVVADEGIWLEGELSKSFKYHAAIKEMVRRGLLHISTDSAPHLVRREQMSNGTNAVKRWPIACASLTIAPAEPRLASVAFKSLIDELGLPLEEEAEPEPETKADDDRVRRLLLELDLLGLEATASTAG